MQDKSTVPSFNTLKTLKTPRQSIRECRPFANDKGQMLTTRLQLMLMAYGTVLGKYKDAFAGKLRRWNDDDKTVEFNVERVRGQYSIYQVKITRIYFLVFG